ncbi:MAG TPA: type I restriction-modification enzyme R subunit C-terminal domain-containing protein [Leptospiraceae bacterium]|nr:type I restriction-modification enzyme R subunit C-terminal domain-containing protein [Leptospiraceae bacterium]HMX35364.1 type I restriction-modification enzyme R subunit C-terminal domain-containing protein [Leptospiraceae bacterium]HMY32419.1 type I restriction-modification enzyme R subunit C-terminal domain-containing protein [Leptospiraceae bacterium]HMZ64174.1 type I restriction-modification enzyme R subunit C-terminal domain-containing protein [Leptospiraceae bacterium]HNA09964.1 type
MYQIAPSRVREIKHTVTTSFWSADGKPITAEEFLKHLLGELPNFFTSEEELRILWSNPITRQTLLENLEDAGFGIQELTTLQQLIEVEKSDLFDVLEYVFNSNTKPITREERVLNAQKNIYASLTKEQIEFVDFVLSRYIETGVEELSQEKLPILLKNKYQSLEDAKSILGEVKEISSLFINFQKFLYT